VAQVEVDPTAAKIVRALIGLAHDMGLDAIAEGVETPGQQAFLIAHGCGFAQGRLYGMAVPGDEASARVRPTAA
jgi:EAL domain-containing protein (putative c-di-GMP-specific phosphodiesterase class I)